MSWTAGGYKLLAEAGFVCSKAVTTAAVLRPEIEYSIHSVFIEALALWGDFSCFDGSKLSLMGTELVKEFFCGHQPCQFGLLFWSHKSDCYCGNLTWILPRPLWAVFLDPSKQNRCSHKLLCSTKLYSLRNHTRRKHGEIIPKDFMCKSVSPKSVLWCNHRYGCCQIVISDVVCNDGFQLHID